MLSRRVIALLTVALVALAAMVVGGQGGCAGGSDGPAGAGTTVRPATLGDAPAVTPTPGGSASAVATPWTTAPGQSPAPADADALAAVRTVKRFCDLVAAHRLHAAAKLLAGPWVWPRRELVPIARLQLVSARVQDGQRTGDVVLLARLRATLRGPSPLHDGVNTLFFTLGRDGTTGGWLITAVTSSP